MKGLLNKDEAHRAKNADTALKFLKELGCPVLMILCKEKDGIGVAVHGVFSNIQGVPEAIDAFHDALAVSALDGPRPTHLN